VKALAISLVVGAALCGIMSAPASAMPMSNLAAAASDLALGQSVRYRHQHRYRLHNYYSRSYYGYGGYGYGGYGGYRYGPSLYGYGGYGYGPSLYGYGGYRYGPSSYRYGSGL
jgi:hypothetical protein